MTHKTLPTPSAWVFPHQPTVGPAGCPTTQINSDQRQIPQVKVSVHQGLFPSSEQQLAQVAHPSDQPATHPGFPQPLLGLEILLKQPTELRETLFYRQFIRKDTTQGRPKNPEDRAQAGASWGTMPPGSPAGSPPDSLGLCGGFLM